MRRKPTGTLSGRLIIYFLIVMLVPFILVVSYTVLNYSRGIEGALRGQAETALEADAYLIESEIQEYRHKAYILSSSPVIISVLEQDDPDATRDNIREVYEEIYGTMAGDTYKAMASIVSITGGVRISTHDFPEVYDLRTHSNEWDSSSIITVARQRTKGERASIISIEDHRIEGGRQVLLSILRRVFSSSGQVVGYVIIDVMADAIIPEVNGSNLFADIVLLDNESYSAISLVHPQRHGDFSEFPFIRDDIEDSYFAHIEGTELEIAAASLNPLIRENLQSWMAILAISLASGIAISIILSLIFSRSISKRMRRIIDSMKSFQKGDFNIKLERTGIREFDELSVTFNIMVHRIELLLKKTREEEAKSAEAERKALESQMNPHFLFNTLNSIKALAKMHGEMEIYQTTLRLGKLLRSSIDNRKDSATIRESLDLVECYLMIQKLRFGDRLSYDICVDDSLLGTETPKLVLQPIVENAVTHGLEEKIGEWNILIAVRRNGPRLLMQVRDNGIGFQTIPDMKDLENSQHTGLYNVYRRLELRYGNDFTLTIGSRPGEGSVITIELPLEEA